MNFSDVIRNIQTLNNNPLNIPIYKLEENSVVTFLITVHARSSTGNCSSWILRRTYKRLTGGNVVSLGTAPATIHEFDSAASGFNATLTSSGDTVSLQLVGSNTNMTTWDITFNTN